MIATDFDVIAPELEAVRRRNFSLFFHGTSRDVTSLAVVRQWPEILDVVLVRAFSEVGAIGYRVARSEDLLNPHEVVFDPYIGRPSWVLRWVMSLDRPGPFVPGTGARFPGAYGLHPSERIRVGIGQMREFVGQSKRSTASARDDQNVSGEGHVYGGIS